MAERVSPVVRGRRLAAELRRLRGAAGLNIDQVAARLECSTAKVSRFENGQVTVRIQDARDLLDLYGVTGARREDLLALVRQSRAQAWWHEYAGMIPVATQTFIGLEDEAYRIQAYNMGLMPGLVQTERYAYEINFSSTDTSLEVVERQTRLRIGRQQILTRPDPALLHLVIDESVLHRQIGAPEVMAEQYRHLIAMSELGNITIQVLPFKAGAHQGAAYSYNIVSFADPADPKIVYVSLLGETLFRTDAEQVGRYNAAFEQAAAIAMDPDASVGFLASLAEPVH
ncbi:MAG TPA: helix-turn-helix transcriptional regulator [Actinocrinis sp.]|nr:helix-turn-helix transcriptional regulator [Actinocrinis sp.]